MPAVAFPTGVLMHPCMDLCSSWTLKFFLGNFTSQIVLYFDWVGRGVRLPPYIFRSVCTRSPLLRSDLEILRISFSLPFISHFRIRFSYIRNHTSIPFFWLEREFLFIAQCFLQRGFPCGPTLLQQKALQDQYLHTELCWEFHPEMLDHEVQSEM